MTKELQDLNVDTVRIDISTSPTVKDLQVWSVTQADSNEFEVVYKVDQAIKEGEQAKDTIAINMIKAHVDSDGYIITQNPTLTSTMKKSSYEPKTKEADPSIDAVITQDATAFLETFFKLCPNATEKELTYNVSVSVKYLDQQTKATQISQYELTLYKDDNWKIVS